MMGLGVPLPRGGQRRPLQALPHRLFSTASRRATVINPPPSPKPDRIQRILHRTPKFLRPTLSALHSAPLTHISAFLILHELTAIIPLLGLVGAFHYYQWLPPFFAEGTWVVAGVEKFGNYFRRKGWIDAGVTREAADLAQRGEAGKVEQGRISRWWNRGETGTRLVVEFATAYAVVKALLPLRLLLSVWGAPWFARWTVVPFNNIVKGLFRRGPKKVGTGTTTAGVNAANSKTAKGENINK